MTTTPNPTARELALQCWEEYQYVVIDEYSDTGIWPDDKTEIAIFEKYIDLATKDERGRILYLIHRHASALFAKLPENWKELDTPPARWQQAALIDLIIDPEF